jgi:hypothetical protein
MGRPIRRFSITCPSRLGMSSLSGANVDQPTVLHARHGVSGTRLSQLPQRGRATSLSSARGVSSNSPVKAEPGRRSSSGRNARPGPSRCLQAMTTRAREKIDTRRWKRGSLRAAASLRMRAGFAALSCFRVQRADIRRRSAWPWHAAARRRPQRGHRRPMCGANVEALNSAPLQNQTERAGGRLHRAVPSAGDGAQGYRPAAPRSGQMMKRHRLFIILSASGPAIGCLAVDPGH